VPLVGGRLSSYDSASEQMHESAAISRSSESIPRHGGTASIVIHGEHLAFLRSNGELSALFWFEAVKD
jgi:hypothetical protein